MNVRYEFDIIGGRMNTPVKFAEEAAKIATEFFGDVVGVKIDVTIKGDFNKTQFTASVVAEKELHP